MFQPVIGLEIHVQIKTKSKMFCRCSADYFGKDPNINVCPVCMGLPGALPVPNKIAFEKVVKLALALECTINQNTKFDRKNYFYPDLPKGYQISQFDQPIGENGYLEIEYRGDARRIRIQRVHLEEDTGKSIHTETGETLLDYNKSGIPLLEIVTFPDFESTEEVILFAKRLRQIVRYLNVSDAEMQKGQMRYELNISVKPDSMQRGELPNYKIEVKNIGSISVLEKVLDFEVARQTNLLIAGEEIKTQTRGLKDMTGETLFQRFKESSNDYRYFPEPDISPILISDVLINQFKLKQVELPHERKHRYMALGLEGEQSDIFVEDVLRGDWFDTLLALIDVSKANLNKTSKLYENTGQLINLNSEYIYTLAGESESFKFSSRKYLLKEVAKWLVGEITGQVDKKNISISNMNLKQVDLIVILGYLNQNLISASSVKKLFELKLEGAEKEIANLIKENSMLQNNSIEEVVSFVKQIISENQKVVEDIEKNTNAIKFLVGQVMKISKGKVNPKVAEEELRKLLNINN